LTRYDGIVSGICTCGDGSKELLPPFVWFIKMARMAGSDDESKLIEQGLSGDPEAYAALVHQHQPMIRAATFRMTGSLTGSHSVATIKPASQTLKMFSVGEVGAEMAWLNPVN
jgi:hypothetical protein